MSEAVKHLIVCASCELLQPAGRSCRLCGEQLPAPAGQLNLPFSEELRTGPGPREAADRTAIRKKREQLVGAWRRTIEMWRYNPPPELRRKLHDEIFSEKVQLTAFEKGMLYEEVLDELLGLGPLSQLLRDPEVREIVVTGSCRVLAIKDHGVTTAPVSFDDPDHMFAVLDRYMANVGMTFDPDEEMFAASCSTESWSYVAIVNAQARGDRPLFRLRTAPRVPEAEDQWVDRADPDDLPEKPVQEEEDDNDDNDN